MKRLALLLLLALAASAQAAKSPAPLSEDAALLHDVAHFGVGAAIGGLVSLGCEATGLYAAHPWIARSLVFGVPTLFGVIHELQDQSSGGKANFEQMGMTSAGGLVVCFFRVERTW